MASFSELVYSTVPQTGAILIGGQGKAMCFGKNQPYSRAVVGCPLELQRNMAGRAVSSSSLPLLCPSNLGPKFQQLDKQDHVKGGTETRPPLTSPCPPGLSQWSSRALGAQDSPSRTIE